MNTRELVGDSIKRSLAKYHEAFTKSIQSRLASLEERVEVVEGSAINISGLSENEIIENIMK